MWGVSMEEIRIKIDGVLWRQLGDVVLSVDAPLSEIAGTCLKLSLPTVKAMPELVELMKDQTTEGGNNV